MDGEAEAVRHRCRRLSEAPPGGPEGTDPATGRPVRDEHAGDAEPGEYFRAGPGHETETDRRLPQCPERHHANGRPLRQPAQCAHRPGCKLLDQWQWTDGELGDVPRSRMEAADPNPMNPQRANPPH